MYVVYLLTWPRSPLIYVGRTSDPSTRLRRHRTAWKYLNIGKPNMEILENNLTESQAYVSEQRWIAFLNSTTQGIGLNKTYGGQTGHEQYVRR